jgi:Transposase
VIRLPSVVIMLALMYPTTGPSPRRCLPGGRGVGIRTRPAKWTTRVRRRDEDGTICGGFDELATLGRTLARRRDDVLAYFTHRASNRPTEAINGRLEPCAATPWDSAT